MKILELGETLTEIRFQEAFVHQKEFVFIIHNGETGELMDKIGISLEGDVELNSIGFNKVETWQDCIVGSLYIPKLMDISGDRYGILFFVNESTIVIVDDGEFALDIIERIVAKKSHQGENKAMFLYNFFTEFLSKDLEVLGQYEKMLMNMEENVAEEKSGDYQREIVPIRKKLLTLRGYYSELADMGKELEDNEIGLFSKKELRYFGIVSDRAERLTGKTAHLLEYAGQVRDAYQAKADSKQSANMQFLTIISTIFFPLTLVTGWYGMNFRNMPELEKGYPGVIALSLCVIIVCIIVFKIKKIF